jgi:hypothetical protein
MIFLEEQVGLAKTAVNFMDSEMYMVAKNFFSWKFLFKIGVRLKLENVFNSK